MRLKKFQIRDYRSISNTTVIFPSNRPVVLFGPNNVGKSNILYAMNCLLGEKYAPYIEFEESDYFQRSKDDNPHISFLAEFDGNIKEARGRARASDTLCFTVNHDFTEGGGSARESVYHYPDGDKMFISNEEKGRCQFILIDATRDISRQLSYFSKYSILSRMARKMHSVVVQEVKEQLDQHFLDLKTTFESVPEYQQFLARLHSSFNSNVDGFEHKLDIDLSAYDPNNYFHSLRIIAKDGDLVRSFDEFGTGEQQILLMSFIKAYAETFTGSNFILGIEEPEAHLHPLAQKWLAKNISEISRGSVQVILTTHSPDFLDIENLEGFVKVYKDAGITKVTQMTTQKLTEDCIALHANPVRTTAETILPFYKANTFDDQLKGFFARKVILVEGATETFSLPRYFENCGYDLIKNGVEVVNCRGKSQIARNYRLFTSFGYKTFCLFDADAGTDPEKIRGNKELSEIFGFNLDTMSDTPGEFICDERACYGYFGKDYESYLRLNLEDYLTKEQSMDGPKPLKAKNIAEENNDYKPSFIDNLAIALDLQKTLVIESTPPTNDVSPDDIPF